MSAVQGGAPYAKESLTEGPILAKSQMEHLLRPAAPSASDYISDIVNALLEVMSTAAPHTEDFSRKVNQLVKEELMPPLLGKIAPIAQRIFTGIPLTALNSPALVKLLPTDEPAITKAKETVKKYLETCSPEKKAVFTDYVNIANEKLPDIFTPLSSKELLTFFQPLIQETVAETVMKNENIQALCRLHAVHALQKRTPKFQELLTDIDRCTKEQKAEIAKAIQEPSTNLEDQTCSSLMGRWTKLQKLDLDNVMKTIFIGFLKLSSQRES